MKAGRLQVAVQGHPSDVWSEITPIKGTLVE
jgi:hypothetical protein